MIISSRKFINKYVSSNSFLVFTFSQLRFKELICSFNRFSGVKSNHDDQYLAYTVNIISYKPSF